MNRTEKEHMFQLYVESKNEKHDDDSSEKENDSQREKADSRPKDGKISKYEKKVADKIAKNDDDPDTHACALKVDHHIFGVGECIYSEHATPDANGYVSWYNVQFDHGTEVVNTKDVNILAETNHGNH